jgi:hypothetical protein
MIVASTSYLISARIGMGNCTFSSIDLAFARFGDKSPVLSITRSTERERRIGS